MPETKDVLIKVRNLKTYYPVKQGVFKHTVGHVKAVDDVSLDVYRGEILGVVGESGCGKTTAFTCPTVCLNTPCFTG